jgi:hypothetical protein
MQLVASDRAWQPARVVIARAFASVTTGTDIMHAFRLEDTPEEFYNVLRFVRMCQYLKYRTMFVTFNTSEEKLY